MIAYPSFLEADPTTFFQYQTKYDNTGKTTNRCINFADKEKSKKIGYMQTRIPNAQNCAEKCANTPSCTAFHITCYQFPAGNPCDGGCDVTKNFKLSDKSTDGNSEGFGLDFKFGYATCLLFESVDLLDCDYGNELNVAVYTKVGSFSNQNLCTCKNKWRGNKTYEYCPDEETWDSSAPIVCETVCAPDKQFCSTKATNTEPGSLSLQQLHFQIGGLPYADIVSGNELNSATDIIENFEIALGYGLGLRGPLPLGRVVTCKFAMTNDQFKTRAICQLNANAPWIDLKTRCTSFEHTCKTDSPVNIIMNQQLQGSGFPWQGKMDLKVVLIGTKETGTYNLIHKGFECEGVGVLLEYPSTIASCAIKCNDDEGCIYFTLGNALASGECWAQKGDGCMKKRFLPADMDLYKLAKPCTRIGQKNTCLLMGCQWFISHCRYYPVAGGWSDWLPWAPCTQTCAEVVGTIGEKKRYRMCNNPEPAHGGMECGGRVSMIESCGTDSCDENLAAQWEEWEAWGSCSDKCLGTGTRTRSRVTKMFPRNRVEHEVDHQICTTVIGNKYTGYNNTKDAMRDGRKIGHCVYPGDLPNKDLCTYTECQDGDPSGACAEKYNGLWFMWEAVEPGTKGCVGSQSKAICCQQFYRFEEPQKGEHPTFRLDMFNDPDAAGTKYHEFDLGLDPDQDFEPDQLIKQCMDMIKVYRGTTKVNFFTFKYIFISSHSEDPRCIGFNEVPTDPIEYGDHTLRNAFKMSGTCTGGKWGQKGGPEAPYQMCTDFWTKEDCDLDMHPESSYKCEWFWDLPRAHQADVDNCKFTLCGETNKCEQKFIKKTLKQCATPNDPQADKFSVLTTARCCKE